LNAIEVAYSVRNKLLKIKEAIEDFDKPLFLLHSLNLKGTVFHLWVHKEYLIITLSPMIQISSYLFPRLPINFLIPLLKVFLDHAIGLLLDGV